jgi:predicted Zn-dependent protease
MERIGDRSSHDAAGRAIRVLASTPCRLALALALLVLAPARAASQDLSPALAARFSGGVADLAAGRLDAAEAAFRAVISGGGDRAFVHHNLGIVLQRRGRHSDALTEFRAASRLDPSFGASHLLEGASLLALGQPRTAVRVLRRASELMPREPAVHLQLGDACERLGDVVCLTDEYRTLVKLAPNDPEYAYRLGKAYVRLSQWTLTRMQTIDPKGARLSQAKGREYLEQGRADLAEAAFLEAVSRDATLDEVHLALARLYLAGGRLDDASRAVARVLALLPDSKAAQALQSNIESARARRQLQSPHQ